MPILGDVFILVLVAEVKLVAVKYVCVLLAAAALNAIEPDEELLQNPDHWLS